jgi:hypothetical protein
LGVGNIIIIIIIIVIIIVIVEEPRWLSDIALGYGLDDRGFVSRQGLGIFLLATVSRPALWGPPRLLSYGYQGLFLWG